LADHDRIAELVRGEFGRPDIQARARERIAWLVENARGRVLDLGCSQGVTTILLARAGHEAVGVDLDPGQIERACAELSARPAPVRERAGFRTGDAAALDFGEASFDTVILGEILEHLADPRPVLREAARVVRDDGVVLVTTPFGWHPHPDHRQTFFVASLVAALGTALTVESVEVQDGYLRARARPGAMGPDEAARAAGLRAAWPRARAGRPRSLGRPRPGPSRRAAPARAGNRPGPRPTRR
jgi:SAM-dependent methyltransferase